MYNDSNITAAINPMEMFTATNQLSEGLLVTALIFCLYIMLFIAFKHKPTRVGMTISSFIIIIISMFAYFLEWITWEILVLPVIMFFISIIVLMFYTE